MEKWINTKRKLFNECTRIVTEKIYAIKNSLNEAQEAANNETKSSAGDKHETGRAMAQLETEKLTTQLSEALKLEQVLIQINPEIEHKKIAVGSLVITNNSNFYISIGLGKIEIEKHSFFVISPASPIGKQLIGLKQGSEFSFNEKKYLIKELI